MNTSSLLQFDTACLCPFKNILNIFASMFQEDFKSMMLYKKGRHRSRFFSCCMVFFMCEGASINVRSDRFLKIWKWLSISSLTFCSTGPQLVELRIPACQTNRLHHLADSHYIARNPLECIRTSRPQRPHFNRHPSIILSQPSTILPTDNQPEVFLTTSSNFDELHQYLKAAPLAH